MSRRRRLATVVRVADLRERVARGQVGLAVAGTARARAQEQACADHLTAALPPALGLADRAQVLALRAGAVRQAGEAVALADAERTAAVDALTAAARRARLLGQLAERLRAEDELTRLAADQRTSDDSTAARRTATRRGTDPETRERR